MIDDPTTWECGSGRVTARRDDNGLVLTWLDMRTGLAAEGLDMVRFNPVTQLLSIFPKTIFLGQREEQFRRVREMQLDTALHAWDSDDPVEEGPRGELELVGMPDGFERIFAYGLGLLTSVRNGTPFS